MDAYTINNKGFYFEGLTKTVLGFGIAGAIILAISIIVVWVTGWCKKDYVKV